MKTCRQCQQTKPESHFWGNKTTKDKLHCWCKVCCAEYKRLWRKHNKEHIKEKSRIYNKKYIKRYPERAADKLDNLRTYPWTQEDAASYRHQHSELFREYNRRYY